MKLIKLALALTLITWLYACNTLDRDTNDIVEGTPTNADSVLYNKSAHDEHHPADTGALHHTQKVFRR